MRELTKNSIVFLLSVVGVLLSIGAHVLIFFANYAALKSAFELIGFEPRALGEDEFWGSFFSATGLGDATVADIYAAGIALLIGVTCIVTFNFLFDAVRLFFDRRAYLASEDLDEQAKAPLALRKMARRLVYVAVLVLPLIFVVFWDLTLFKIRLEGNLRNVQNPEELLNWAPDSVSRLGEYGDWLLGRNGVGYVAATILACLLLEIAFEKMSESFDNLCYAGSELFSPSEEESPAAASNTQTTRTSNANEDVEWGEDLKGPTSAGPVEAPSNPTSVHTQDEGALPFVEVPLPGSTRSAPPPTIGQEEAADLVEVLTASGSERIPRANVATRQDLIADSTGRYWSRDYYEKLHAEEVEEDEAQAA